MACPELRQGTSAPDVSASPATAGELSLTRLGCRLVRLVLLLWWRRALRVLAVGDCHIH